MGRSSLMVTLLYDEVVKRNPSGLMKSKEKFQIGESKQQDRTCSIPYSINNHEIASNPPHVLLRNSQEVQMKKVWEELLEENFGFLVSDYEFRLLSDIYRPEHFGNRQVIFGSKFCLVELNLDRHKLSIYFKKPEDKKPSILSLSFFIAIISNDPDFRIREIASGYRQEALDAQMKSKGKMLEKWAEKIFLLFERNSVNQLNAKTKHFLSQIDDIQGKSYVREIVMLLWCTGTRKFSKQIFQ